MNCETPTFCIFSNSVEGIIVLKAEQQKGCYRKYLDCLDVGEHKTILDRQRRQQICFQNMQTEIVQAMDVVMQTLERLVIHFLKSIIKQWIDN